MRGGFRCADVQISEEPLTDAIGREAIAQTTISGRDFCLLIRPGLSEAELSITLYHEVLEAATVACDDCPSAVAEFNEGDFERVARRMHQQFGAATPASINRMLEEHGF
ncbi:MAG TPA: hypothetical protein VI454_17020 [Verrucomicrobiae bacterium]